MLSGKNENGINYYTARKLKDMAQSLEQLAKAFDEGAGETMSLTKDDGLAAMQTCAALVCGNCGGCSLYADSEKEDSYYLYYLLRIFEQNGRIGTEDMPELFKKDCRRKRDYLEQLNRSFTRASMNLSWKNRFLESRDVVISQFRELAVILEEFSRQIDEAKNITEEYKGAVKKAFRRYHILVDSMLLLEYESGRREIYLTAKTITRTVAEEAFSILKEHGLKFKVITITAKEKLCFCDKTECNPENCLWARGHLDRVNDAVFELWTTQDSYDRDTLLEYAKKWQVCPFEMCLDLAVWVDAVICDYNYVFDPNVYLKRFFGEGTSGEYIFLIDEAHNLVDRGREMYSAHVDRADVLEAKRLAGDYSKGLVRALEKVNRQLRILEKECTEYEILPNPGAVSLGMLQVMGEMDKLLEELHGKELPEQLLEFYFCVRDFLNIDELLDENYVVYAEMGEGGKVILRLFCVNPAANIHRCLEKGKSAVFFSATLLPMDYYRTLLSTRKDDYGIYVTSPFRQENRCILTGRDVSSRYTRRGYEEYHRIASYIARTVWTRKGNYMVFFPSYKFMEDVLEVYENEFSAEWVRCISQTSGMNEREKEEFLEEFSASEGTLVGFCVMGGIFSEGIDLMGEKLIGAIIIGTGLPQIGTEREILRQYYDKKGVNGFDYAYRYPGMNKVLQSAGRVIRTQEDTGIILLLDERFAGKDYRNLFPAEWSDRGNCTLNTVEEQLGSFWNRIREKN